MQGKKQIAGEREEDAALPNRHPCPAKPACPLAQGTRMFTHALTNILRHTQFQQPVRLSRPYSGDFLFIFFMQLKSKCPDN
jgi:hypothetical protein